VSVKICGAIMSPTAKSAETRSRISDTTSRLEDVFIRLLTETDELRNELEDEVKSRERDIAAVKEVVKNNFNLIRDALDKEKW
jgi:hypothetical protein